jgi:hypothetical protein
MNLDGRKVVDIELDGIDYNDAPDFADAFVCYAAFDDTGESLTDEELDRLVSENYGEISEMIWESR